MLDTLKQKKNSSQQKPENELKNDGGKIDLESNTNILLRLPENFPTLEADQAALLQWAYFEATAIVKQYGDLLEDVSSYLSSGTSTVGECAFMIEKEMS